MVCACGLMHLLLQLSTVLWFCRVQRQPPSKVNGAALDSYSDSVVDGLLHYVHLIRLWFLFNWNSVVKWHKNDFHCHSAAESTLVRSHDLFVLDKQRSDWCVGCSIRCVDCPGARVVRTWWQWPGRHLASASRCEYLPDKHLWKHGDSRIIYIFRHFC